jgi:D-threo-aldose 1-dehydrogenase
MTRTLARREIGRTGLEISTLGFGGAGIGNLYRVVREEDASDAITASLAAGVRYFDTAPFYGFGLSENRLGAALRAESSPPVISTKVGRRLVPTGPQDENVGRECYFSPSPFAPVFDYGYDAVMESHARSLERLGVRRVDILLCHDIGRLTHGAQHEARVREFLEGGYRAMRELRDLGAVRAIGLGVNESQVCVELLEHCELDCIMLAGRYTLLEQEPLDKLLPECAARGVSILCAGPFNSGILAAGSGAGARVEQAALAQRVPELRGNGLVEAGGDVARLLAIRRAGHHACDAGMGERKLQRRGLQRHREFLADGFQRAHAFEHGRGRGQVVIVRACGRARARRQDARIERSGAQDGNTACRALGQ